MYQRVCDPTTALRFGRRPTARAYRKLILQFFLSYTLDTHLATLAAYEGVKSFCACILSNLRLCARSDMHLLRSKCRVDFELVS